MYFAAEACNHANEGNLTDVRIYRGADKFLARPGRKQAIATEDLMFIYHIYNHISRNISTIYIYITRLASKEIFSQSNKIHREVGRAKDLSAPLYLSLVTLFLLKAGRLSTG